MHKSDERLTAILNETSESYKKLTKVDARNLIHKQESIFARIAQLNKQWESGLLNSEQTN